MGLVMPPTSAAIAATAVMAQRAVIPSPQIIEPQRSFVDGIGGKSVFPQMFERARQLLDGVLVAEVGEVASALRLMAERNRIIAEGAGAAPVACALAHDWGVEKPKIACVVSGGNIDLSKLAEIFGTK